MATTTTNYGFNISEGTDLVNPLMDIFPNWTAIDSDLKAVSNSAVGTAIELLTGTVHALTRTDTDRNVFVFTATSNFTAGDTFTLDGVQVTALTPAGEQLATGCYIIGSDVIVSVHGTLMTMYVSPTKVADSDKLDGHDSTYFATASDLGTTDGNVSALSNKVGTGVLTTDAQDCVGAINELNSDLTVEDVSSDYTANGLDIATAYKIGNVIHCSVNSDSMPLGAIWSTTSVGSFATYKPKKNTFIGTIYDGNARFRLYISTSGVISATNVSSANSSSYVSANFSFII